MWVLVSSFQEDVEWRRNKTAIMIAMIFDLLDIEFKKRDY